MSNERPFSDERRAKIKAPAKPAAKPIAKADARPDAPKLDPKTDKRERILRAAVKVFARKGFYATRVSEIAKAAGVADGTIYLYFENKDDVLVSLFQDRITKLIAALEEIVAPGPQGEGPESEAPSFDQRFQRVVELQLGLLDGRRDLAEVVTVNLRQSSRLLKQFATPLFTRYLEVMAGLIAEGQRDGAVRLDLNPRIVARSLFGALDGVAVTWALGGGEAGQLKKAATQVSDLFLQGLHVLPGAQELPGAQPLDTDSVPPTIRRARTASPHAAARFERCPKEPR